MFYPIFYVESRIKKSTSFLHVSTKLKANNLCIVWPNLNFSPFKLLVGWNIFLQKWDGEIVPALMQIDTFPYNSKAALQRTSTSEIDEVQRRPPVINKLHRSVNHQLFSIDKSSPVHFFPNHLNVNMHVFVWTGAFGCHMTRAKRNQGGLSSSYLHIIFNSSIS